MTSTSVLAAIILFAQAAATTPAAPAAEPGPVSEQQRGDLRCAAAFAIVASEQERGVAGAADYPHLAQRGMDFFTTTALSVMAATSRTKEQVGELMVTEVARLQQEVVDGQDPDAVIAAVMAPCLARMEEVVAAYIKPSVLQCAGVMRLAYDEVVAEDGAQSASAMDLQTLATVLDSRARDQLRAEGMSTNEMDEAITLAREKLVADAEAGQSANLDYEHCFELAAPDPQEANPHG